MNAVSLLIGRITQILSAPFRLVGSVQSRLRGLNPFRGLRTTLRSFAGMPQRMAGPFRPLLKKVGIKVPDTKGEKRGARDDMRDLFARDAERKRRQPVAQRAQVSQIHLVGRGDARYIVHIGSSAGRVASPLQIYSDGSPLTLRFEQADPPDARTPVVLAAVTGHAEIKLNEAPLKLPAPLRFGDTLSIDGVPYSVELYFWDKTPVVTRVDASYATSTGPTRENNEDAIAVAQHPRAYIFAVADGVGGGQDGDQISAFAAKYLLAAFHRNVNFTLPWPDILLTAFKHINAEVRAWVRRSPNPAGTTLTAVVVKDWNAHIAHTGDSRAYLFRQGFLKQLTTDHVNQQQVELPTMYAVEQTEPVPLRDVLTRAIGKTDAIEPQMLTVPLAPGDKLLLTTDGLTNTVPVGDLTTYLKGNTPYAAELMIRRAVELDAKDNVSAVVIEVLTEAYVEDIWDAYGSDRVFAGYNRSWSLKLRKPGEAITQVESTGTGCLTFIVLLAATIAAYLFFNR